MAKTAPSVVERLLQVRDPSGGVDLLASPTTMRPNRSRLCLNWSLEEPGALITMPGFVSFSTTSLGGTRAQGGQRIYIAGVAPFTLVAYAGSIYKPSDGGVWGTSVLAGLSAINEIYFPYDRTMVAVFDGATIPKKSKDGVIWTQDGIDAPSLAATLSAVAGGSLLANNTYEVSYAYRDTSLAHTGNEGPLATQATSGTNKTVRCDIPRSTDSQVTTIVVYVRNTSTGESVRRKVGTVSNPVSGSALFDITAESWATNEEAPTNHGVATAMRFAVFWKYRWWGLDGTTKNRLRFSQIFDNQSWPPDFFVDIPLDRGEDVQAIIPLGDTLILSGYTTFVAVIGQTALDFEVRPVLGAEQGTLGQRAWAKLETGLVHAAPAGVYNFDGATDRLLSFEITPAWQDMMARATTADTDRVAVVLHVQRKEVRIAVPRLYPTNLPGEWILNLNRTRIQERFGLGPAWSQTDRSIGGYISWDGREQVVGNPNRLFSWNLTLGKLFEEAVGTTADGADLTAEYDGPGLSTGLQTTRFPNGYVEVRPSSGTFTIDARVDNKSLGSQSLAIGSTLSQYGKAKYGTSVYAGVARKVIPFTLPLEAEGVSIQMIVKYVGRAKSLFYTYAFTSVSEPFPRGL